MFGHKRVDRLDKSIANDDAIDTRLNAAAGFDCQAVAL